MPSDPLVLGFDTSAAHCAAALLCGDRVVASVHEDMGRGQAERLMPLLEDVLAQGGTTWAALDAIGVGTGPGNFTGIRISVATARGLALGLGCPAIGVNGFDALAYDARDVTTLCAVPAPRDHLYLSANADLPARLAPVSDAAERTVICATDTPAMSAAGVRVIAPAHPIAEAIARVAIARIGQDVSRPVPLYIRPADAAPSREAAPIILP